MDNNNTIQLKNLQHLQINAPSHLFNGIMQQINDGADIIEQQVKLLSQHSIVIPKQINIDTIIQQHNNSTLHIFKQLQQYKLPAPQALWQNIEHSIFGKQKAKIIPLVWKKLAAAVVIFLVGLSCFYLYNNSTQKTKSSSEILATATQKNTANTPVLLIDSIKLNVPINEQQKSNNTSVKYNADNNTTYSFNKIKKTLPTSINNAYSMQDGSQLNIQYNDFLSSFASFNITNTPSFLLAAKPQATVITVDNFTAIEVSEKMATLLQKLYTTKANGKPTRAAKKQQKLIKKWQKADALYFNNNSFNNPLDPVDLGNFILHK